MREGAGEWAAADTAAAAAAAAAAATNTTTSTTTQATTTSTTTTPPLPHHYHYNYYSAVKVIPAAEAVGSAVLRCSLRCGNIRRQYRSSNALFSPAGW